MYKPPTSKSLPWLPCVNSSKNRVVLSGSVIRPKSQSIGQQARGGRRGLSVCERRLAGLFSSHEGGPAKSPISPSFLPLPHFRANRFRKLLGSNSSLPSCPSASQDAGEGCLKNGNMGCVTIVALFILKLCKAR